MTMHAQKCKIFEGVWGEISNNKNREVLCSLPCSDMMSQVQAFLPQESKKPPIGVCAMVLYYYFILFCFLNHAKSLLGFLYIS